MVRINLEFFLVLPNYLLNTGAQFEGMKLGGIILISVGFFLVMFPNNWPDYILRVAR